jgi:hypothetical protein
MKSRHITIDRVLLEDDFKIPITYSDKPLPTKYMRYHLDTMYEYCWGPNIGFIPKAFDIFVEAIRWWERKGYNMQEYYHTVKANRDAYLEWLSNRT